MYVDLKDMFMLKKTFFLLSLAVLSSSLFAGDGERGKTLFAKCISCHGQDGMGKESMKAPRIAGQYDWYIISALKAFKSKERSNPTMYPFIKDLSEKDFEDLSTYLSSL